MNETWTSADEQKLADMQARKTRVQEARRAPLLGLVSDDMPHIRMAQADDVVDFLIENADTIRDLLQPFDSGVRSA